MILRGLRSKPLWLMSQLWWKLEKFYIPYFKTCCHPIKFVMEKVLALNCRCFYFKFVWKKMKKIWKKSSKKYEKFYCFYKINIKFIYLQLIENYVIFYHLIKFIRLFLIIYLPYLDIGYKFISAKVSIEHAKTF